METNYETRIINHALKTCGYYPLRAIQLWLVDTHFNKVNSTMMNIGAFMQLSPQIDLQRLADAINDLLNAYDIFRCRLVFHPATDDFCQRFDGEIVPVTVEKLSDEEFARRKETLMQPYALMNKPLYRIYLFETPSANYWYVDFYHALLDGTAAAILFYREVDLRYRGKAINRVPPKYADYILEEMKVSPEELAAGNVFWRKTLENFDESKHLPPPDIHAAHSWKSNDITAPIDNITPEYFWDNARKETVFFLAATMLTIAKTTGAKDSVMSWLHNGRNNALERRLMGIMLEQFPISWDFEKDISVSNFLDGLEEKMNLGITYRRSLGMVYSEGLEDDCATFIFQKRNTGKLDQFSIGGHIAKIIDLPPNDISAAENTLDIEINLYEGKYFVFLDFDAGRYSQNSMKNFAAILDDVIFQLQDESALLSEILS